MNAYKLADELQTIRKQIWYDINHEIAKNIDEKANVSANMLRQQADRIAELESCINDCYTVQKMQAEENLKGADRIAELEKELQNKAMDEVVRIGQEIDAEPVAWISKYSLKDIEQTWELTSLSPFKDDYFDIPLYTTPQTELNAGGEPVKNATYWKRQYNEMSATNDRLKSSLYHANEQIKYLESTPQTKPLSDEEIEPVAEMMADMYNDISLKWKNSRGYSEQCEIMSMIFRAIEERILGK